MFNVVPKAQVRLCQSTGLCSNIRRLVKHTVYAFMLLCFLNPLPVQNHYASDVYTKSFIYRFLFVPF